MKIKLINFGYKNPPKRGHYNDAGADVYATQTVVVEPHTTYKMPLGFGLELPDGYYGMIFGRSSTYNKGITMGLPPIDSGYKGEIHCLINNFTDVPYYIEEGDRVGQLVIMPVTIAEFVEDLGDERGSGAFGSTGK